MERSITQMAKGEIGLLVNDLMSDNYIKMPVYKYLAMPKKQRVAFNEGGGKVYDLSGILGEVEDGFAYLIQR